MTETTTTEKAAPAKKAKKATAKKKDKPGKDRFGSREGSQAAAINSAMTSKPKEVEKIAEEAKATTARVRAHLKRLIRLKFVVEKDGAYRAK